jgi:hypothetical protein
MTLKTSPLMFLLLERPVDEIAAHVPLGASADHQPEVVIRTARAGSLVSSKEVSDELQMPKLVSRTAR